MVRIIKQATLSRIGWIDICLYEAVLNTYVHSRHVYWTTYRILDKFIYIFISKYYLYFMSYIHIINVINIRNNDFKLSSFLMFFWVRSRKFCARVGGFNLVASKYLITDAPGKHFSRSLFHSWRAWFRILRNINQIYFLCARMFSIKMFSLFNQNTNMFKYDTFTRRLTSGVFRYDTAMVSREAF